MHNPMRIFVLFFVFSAVSIFGSAPSSSEASSSSASTASDDKITVAPMIDIESMEKDFEAAVESPKHDLQKKTIADLYTKYLAWLVEYNSGYSLYTNANKTSANKPQFPAKFSKFVAPHIVKNFEDDKKICIDSNASRTLFSLDIPSVTKAVALEVVCGRKCECLRGCQTEEPCWFVNQVPLDVCDSMGNLPLHGLVGYTEPAQKQKVFKQLLGRGPSLHKTDQRGNTILHELHTQMPTTSQDKFFVPLVLQKLQSHPARKAIINHQNNDGDTALLILIKRHNGEIHACQNSVHALVEMGADPGKANKNGESLAKIAAGQPMVLWLESYARQKNAEQEKDEVSKK